MATKQDTVNIFTQQSGTIHLGGIDALVRLTLDQIRADERRGLRATPVEDRPCPRHLNDPTPSPRSKAACTWAASTRWCA